MSEKPLQDLELIKKMVGESQGIFNFGSIYFILWGIIIPVATLGMFIAVKSGNENLVGIIWAVLCTLGGCISAIIGIKTKIPHKTVFTSLYGVVWLSLAFGYTVALVFRFIGVIDGKTSLFLICVLLGIGHVISGYMHRSKLVILSGIAWNVLSVFILLVQASIIGYVMGFAPLFITLLPGLILRRQNGRL